MFIAISPDDNESLYILMELLCVVDHPITYLYNTLHYYHKILVQRAAYKRRLVTTIWSKGLLAIVTFNSELFVLFVVGFCIFLATDSVKKEFTTTLNCPKF